MHKAHAQDDLIPIQATPDVGFRGDERPHDSPRSGDKGVRCPKPGFSSSTNASSIAPFDEARRGRLRGSLCRAIVGMGDGPGDDATVGGDNCSRPTSRVSPSAMVFVVRRPNDLHLRRQAKRPAARSRHRDRRASPSALRQSSNQMVTICPSEVPVIILVPPINGGLQTNASNPPLSMKTSGNSSGQWNAQRSPPSAVDLPASSSNCSASKILEFVLDLGERLR